MNRLNIRLSFCIMVSCLAFLLPGLTYAATPQVSAGLFHSVGLQGDGTVVAVGGNDYGQCDVGGWAGIQQISTGDVHTVGLQTDGTVVAAGRNNKGQCNVGGWTGIQQISAGAYHTVGLKADGTVVAIGENTYGQCDVAGWTNIQQVSAGDYHTVGLRTDGTAVAAGDNFFNQGDVGGWSGIKQVSAGGIHTVGLKTDGTVVAVGDNGDGQCNVGGWSGIKQVSAGFFYSVGLQTDGTVVAVGYNGDGQCNVGGWSDIQQLEAGASHTVGLKTDGSAVAVGDNADGQCNVGGWDLGGPEIDCGDAPDSSYPTLLASDGARHTIDPGLYLGAAIDGESDGQPNATATGDDNADTDDEDGVSFDGHIIAGKDMTLTVTASDSGRLDAWIDFNRDDDWADAGEQVFANQALTTGDNPLTVAVPADAAAGDTFARFRFSTAGGLSYTGAAADGEVEDYALEIIVCSSPPPASILTSPKNTTVDVAMPVYVWESAPCTDYYYLLIQNQAKKTIFRKKYPAATVDNGDGTCSINPLKVLTTGLDYYWLVRPTNQYGAGSNSAKALFTVDTTQVPPAAATLNTPTGTITDTMPTFDWDTVATADYYTLIIQNQFQKTIFKQEYPTATVDNLDGTCSINPGKTLAPGDYYWLVRAKNQYGAGYSSAKMAFTISP